MKKMKLLLILVFFAAGISLLNSCKKDPKPPTLTTSAVTDITVSSAKSGGDITSDGGADISARGLCWGTTTNPDISGSYTSDGSGSGSFVSNLTGLTPNTLYHVRAFATNEAGTSYGEDISFTTIQIVVPTITTAEVTSITYTTAVSGGNITADGNAPVTERGLCWSTAINPTISDSKTSDGTGTGSFVSNLTGLTAGTIYHVRAYATNSAGTAYGADVTFTASALAVPTLTTDAATAVTVNSAVSGGNVLSDGGTAVTGRGVCWALTENPTILNSVTSDASGLGAFTSNLTGLQPGTTYHVRAYAVNSAGTAYGNDVVLTTLPSVPSLTTAAISALTSVSAVSGGNITDDNGADVTARGIVWGTTTAPTLDNLHTTNEAGTGVFTSSMTDLAPGTVYYVRAYATNSVGTAYGNELSFTTPVTLATVTTSTPDAIGQTTATAGGNITSAGGAAVTARGVAYGISANPTISGTRTNDGTGVGNFTSDLTGLTSGTLYHIRAYATTSAGTAYGQDLTFTTNAAGFAVLTSTAVSAIGLTTATSGGDITDDGTGTITERGVCWSTTANPTIAGSHTSDGTGMGPFTSNLTGLTEDMTYYVRAYATNTAGTTYGNEFVFHTDLQDRENNTYDAVLIGAQVWMADNLRTTTFSNGDAIPTTLADITGSTDPYQWAYENNNNNIPVYGLLYTWYAAIDTRNVCPTGWHVPTDAQLESMKTFLGGEAVAGGKLKETGTTNWYSPNTGATNETGFTAVASGYRTPNGLFTSGPEIDVAQRLRSFYIWSSSPGFLPADGWGQGVSYSNTVMLKGGYPRADGAAIRCLKN